MKLIHSLYSDIGRFPRSLIKPRSYIACRKIGVVLFCAILLAGCASRPPSSQEDLCKIFEQKPGWYASSVKAANFWKGPIDVPMAIMAQESAFRAKARPPIRFFLGFIPYGRASNAYGYPQALNSTWATYRKDAGSIFSQRDNFDDSIDFIQWYMHQTALQNKVPKTDAYAQYLNYHEGQGGYRRATYKNKKWLINTAKRVQRRASSYKNQLASCQPALEKRRKRRWFF